MMVLMQESVPPGAGWLAEVSTWTETRASGRKTTAVGMGMPAEGLWG